jgi:hypothetical protein
VKAKELLLPREERDLSVLLWIGQAIPALSRWSPVFRRYLEIIARRVKEFGGDPAKILPSPTGGGEPAPPVHKPPKGEERVEYTGKIDSLVFDDAGDFEGFVLSTPEHRHKYFSREKEMAHLAERAWRDRLRVTVSAERDAPHRPLHVVLHQPPVTIGR